jgi:hypothetical protein
MPVQKNIHSYTFMLQIAVLSNHLNGRDIHVRQIKIYGPRPKVGYHTSTHLLTFLFFFQECMFDNF